MNTKLTKLATMGAAATAIGAVGFFTVPAPAQAAPLAPLPLAPACDSYGFNPGGNYGIRQDNGWGVDISGNGPTAAGDANAHGDSGATMHGSVSGGVNGRSVDVTINWDSGPRGHFTGVVDEDGFATGTSTDLTSGNSTGWHAIGRLVCLTAPPPEQVPLPRQGVPITLPPPQQAPPPVTGTAGPSPYPLATVLADNNVYDKINVPEGTGHIIGMLQAGRQVQVQGTCTPGDAEGKAGDWNHVVVPDMPGGTGYAWGFIVCP
jgi:hypothetical protein